MQSRAIARFQRPWPSCAAWPLLRDKKIKDHVVPIICDEARTFGMEGLFRQIGIYAPLRPALRTGRFRPAGVLQGSEGGPGAAGRHHRGRFDEFLDRRGDQLCLVRCADDSVLRLLLDVRFPAHRRPGLGGRRHACPRFPDRRHLGSDHAQRRGLAARRRPQPGPGRH
jgi:hypothetical protein